MKSFFLTILLVLIPALSYSQGNAIEDFFEKLYHYTFQDEHHTLKFISDGVEMDGKLQFTGTKFFLKQGPNTILTAVQSSNNDRETFTVNLDSGIVVLKKAHLTLYAKAEEPAAMDTSVSQQSQDSSTDSQGGNLGISFDFPIEGESDTHAAQLQPTLVEPTTTANDKKKETAQYVNVLASCQKNLRDMERIIAVYDTCGRQSLLIRYDSIAQANESMLESIDKSIVIYNQRLQKSESDYLSRLARVQANHDSILNFLPEMIEAEGFSFLVDSKKKEVVLYHPIDKSLSVYHVPSTVTYRIHTLNVVGIGAYAFEGLTQLAEIELPPTVLEIRAKAFLGCSGLRKIRLSEHLTTIGEEAFKDCQSLRDVTLPGTLTSIESSAFSHCTSLKEVVAEMPHPVLLGEDAFDTAKANNTLLVLQNGSFHEYLQSPWALSFVSIKEVFTESVPSAHLLTDSHTFLIKSNGTADFLSFPIKPYQDDFTVPEKIFDNSYTVTGIGSGAFYNQVGLKTVFLPNSIEAIGDSAFAFCKNLNQIQLPRSLKNIGEKAFLDCKKLRSISFPEGVSDIKDEAFAFCSSLDSIQFPHGITAISDRLCLNCDNLRSVFIPSSVSSIGEYAFQSCKKLQSITLRMGTREVGRGAFSECQGLILVELPSTIATLKEGCFGGCDDIAAVYCHSVEPPLCADNAFSPNVIDAVIYVPDHADDAYKSQGFLSRGFDKIKTLPNEEKLEKHKAKSLQEGLEDVLKKPRLREKRAQKGAKQSDRY